MEGRTMSDEKFMTSCELCGKSFRFGPHIYDGKVIPRYEITVCMVVGTVIGTDGVLTMRRA